MNSTFKQSLFLIAMIVSIPLNAGNKSKETIKQVPFTNVHFTDNFWAPRIEINRTVSIPSAFSEKRKKWTIR